MMLNRTLLPAAITLALGLAAGGAEAAVVYSENFESGVAVNFTGAGAVEGTAGYAAKGFGTKFLRNNATGKPAPASILTVGGLGAHTALTLKFDLAIIDSWDGSLPFDDISPDIFNVVIDGQLVFSATFDNQGGPQSGPGMPGVTTIVGPTANLGFCSADQCLDSAYSVLLTLTLPEATGREIQFFASGDGWEGAEDESWALDNITVSTGAVPEPATLALFGAGLAGLALARRRRRA